MVKFFTGVGIFLLLLLVGIGIFLNFTPMGREIQNNYFHSLQKADDRSLYETKKKVEDQCRAMITTYNAKKVIWEQGKDSENEIEKQTAVAAKIVANQTASKYNNYILKNNYVWAENVPDDIYLELDILE